MSFASPCSSLLYSTLLSPSRNPFTRDTTNAPKYQDASVTDLIFQGHIPRSLPLSTSRPNKCAMMMKEPISTEDGSAPKFESTLVIAFPDVSMAGPRILLSSSSQSTESNRHAITTWSQYCSPPPSRKKKIAATSTHNNSIPKIVYSASAASANLGLLTVTVAPSTTEQATHLCEAIVNHARESGTRHIIIVAASNFASQTPETHIIQLHNVTAGSSPLKPAPSVPLGDHILNTFLTLLTFNDIPTTILVQPAKKGSSIRDTKVVIEDLTGALSAAVGSTNAHMFSASRAIAFNSFQREEEEAVESMMYL